MNPARRVGAILLVVGALLEAVRVIVGAIISVPAPAVIQICISSLPSSLIGAGLAAVGTSVQGRGRPTLIAAGALYLVAVVVNVMQILLGSPLGPAPSQLAIFAEVVAVVVAAALMLSDMSLSGPVRWSMAVPAACILLVAATFFIAPWLYVLPELGFVVAGALLLRRPSLHLRTA